ncbi:molybdopterin molybdochelatase [Syntrophus gentianae]|uniref:Molybdopterin molybdenumtransferase n=1 Tax=Syntrophus gentianae TaxID=43775 RepID=A0A1H8AU21_9BACT|nr:molybdopterin biosynthesis protein [Syntrophus gentianae]SEM74210.1 molybdopterin molybdochelatase [Syntrophus gentianae]
MSKNRKFYLEDIPLDEAWRRFIAAMESSGLWKALPGEDLPLEEALGRVTAVPVWATLSSPGYHASAMDGYAVRSMDTLGATETAPKRLRIGPDRQAEYVDTGDPLPSWADAIIQIEHTQHIDEEADEFIEIQASVAPWTAVRPMGEDMVATELVLPANRLLKPVDLGALAGCGHATVSVRRRPRVAVIPTGTELVTVEQAAQEGLKSGDIIEYNSLVLSSQVRQWGGEPTRYPIVVDDYERIRETVREAAAIHDLVLVNAGSSAGSEDFTSSIVEELGTLLVHGVAIRPGHPVVLGTVTDRKTPIIGVPGYPVSCALTGEIFVEPLLSHWLGVPSKEKPKLKATISRKLLSPMGEDEWVRVTVGRVGERTVAAPLSRGAGVITSLVRADGIVRIPRFSEGVEAGREVNVELYRDPSDIDRTIVHIGSHDLCLDMLSQYLADAGRLFSSANAGSLGGLMALRRGDAHLAASHLLDPATGEYNISYVKQYLPNIPVVLMTFLHREQGLIIAPGNPRGIQGLSDLVRDDVRYVNRQRGAGTRVLLDYHLNKLGIEPERVKGYRREEYTHLAVAVAVQSGAADCGLGIASAAHALQLDFLPFEKERYDLVIPRIYYESDLLQPLLDLIHGPVLRRVVNELPGYDTTSMGTIVV